MPGFEVFGEEERNHINDVLENGVLMRYGFDAMRNGHHKAKEFELAFAEKMKVNHCQLTSSGTSALTVALASAGIGAGDEVIIPTFTFVASFESIIALGAVPILCDIDDTLCLSPEAVKKAITPKTKVVMPVHMCGSMADLKSLKEICDQHDLLLLEDACQAIGGTYDDNYLGTYGDLGCFSFDYVKTITCGEGGAMITNNHKYATNADQFQDHGHDHIGSDRGAEQHPFLGYNYRISELNAAVGLGQLTKFDHVLAKQREHYSILRETLSSIEEVTFRRVPDHGVESGAFLNFFLPDQETAKRVHTQLGRAGIDACFYWFDNNWHYYKKWDHLKNQRSMGKLPQEVRNGMQDFSTIDFSASDHWMSRTISCLVKVGWSEEEVQQRGAKMKQVISNVLSTSPAS
ncbi:DegT/DnrJ/EryC1/StrS family aminotransferase [Gangjinia marincola]|uniref:DegT/DnrJ/EryC1/StrS family aminotransferase n=1 Tax=Gangjinia marincola TaxID=578463 RepID=A0ABP3XR92_9FLAO